MELGEVAGKSELDSLASLACRIFDVAEAAIVLADDRVAAAGRLRGGRPDGLDGGVLNLALDAGRPIVIADAARDTRLAGVRLRPGGPPVRFYAAVPITLEDGAGIGTFCLIDARPRRFEAEEERRLAEIARIAAALLGEASLAHIVRRLAAALAEQERLAAERHASVVRYKKMYDRSSALARIGVWECDLADGALTWTDGVYDIFELPRGAPVTRETVLPLYYEDSRRRMEALRRKAIAEGTGFCLDIQVRTAKGNRRWVRLSADVESENGVPVRLFGLKQDVTQERTLLDRLRRLAEYDPLTGLANRAMFESRLAKALAPRARAPSRLALLLVDLDGFKAINDTFGHAVGDACLKEIARRLRVVVKRPNLIGRIGGDEFAILASGARNVGGIEETARRLMAEIGRPMECSGRALQVGASIGLSIPHGAGPHSPTRLFSEADHALYEAKNAGRNAYRVYRAAADGQDAG